MHPNQPSSTPHRSPTALALLRQCKSLPEIKQIHAHSIRHSPSQRHFVKHLIFALASLSAVPYAELVFSQTPDPDVFTINTMIRLHAESSDPRPALSAHLRLILSPHPPDTHTFPFLLKACARLLSLRAGQAVHARALRAGLGGLVFVHNALLHFYSACGLFELAHKLFDGMPQRNLVTYNSAINGFALNGRPNEALTLFRQMTRDESIHPDGFTIVSLLSASAELGALALGRRTHTYITKVGFRRNHHVANALIDLYSKCGVIDDARSVFRETGVKNVVSWNSLIVGLAANGCGEEALELFRAMQKERIGPTDITLVGVLYACSHCGLVDEGLRYFERMKAEYDIVPKIEHYGCMVDLLGRSGLVEDAFRFIKDMPFEPNAVVWRTLLGACTMHKLVSLAEEAWAHLARLDPGHSGDYVLLSNLYAAVGMWGDVQRLRRSMLKGGVRKNPGRSLVELGNHVHEFVMGDRSHPQSEDIYAKLEEVGKRLRIQGYVPRITNVLADIEEEEKETALNYHSERLAIAFALLCTGSGTPIRIVKNLRVCSDCHLAIKLISKVYDREIVVRDRSRFHHFRNGLCSCKNYW